MGFAPACSFTMYAVKYVSLFFVLECSAIPSRSRRSCCPTLATEHAGGKVRRSPTPITGRWLISY